MYKSTHFININKMMMKQFIPILYLAMSGFILVQAHKMSSNYEKIDDHLSRKVRTDDPQENLAVARAWLEKLKKKSCSRFSCFGPSDPEMLTDLEQFVNLESVLDESKRCTFEAFKILSRNDYNAGGVSDGYKNPSSLRTRVSRVIFDYDSKHTEICQKLFPDHLATKIEVLSTQTKDFVSRLGNQHHVAGMSDERFESIDYAVMIRTEIIRLMDGDFMFDWGKVKHDQLDRYILSPCRELDEAIDEDLRARANAQAKSMYCLAMGPRDYYTKTCNNIAAANFCHFVAHNESLVWKLTQESVLNHRQREADNKIRDELDRKRGEKARAEAQKRREDREKEAKTRYSSGNNLIAMNAGAVAAIF